MKNSPIDFTLDCEFNGYQGELLALALYSRYHSLYLVVEHTDPQVGFTPWVAEHVVPYLNQGPDFAAPDLGLVLRTNQFTMQLCTPAEIPQALEDFFRAASPNAAPRIHCDWPDDVKYLSELLLTGPGTMIQIPGIGFQVHRVDAYPTTIKSAIQHHAWWDAYVLYEHLRQAAIADWLNCRPTGIFTIEAPYYPPL